MAGYIVPVDVVNQDIKHGLLVDKFGYIPDLDTTDVNLVVWPGDKTSYKTIFPTTAQTVTISSDSAADTAAGTGGQELTVEWLDSNLVQTVTTGIPTNGLSASTVTLSDCYRINRAFLTGSGSNFSNVGNIWLGWGTITSGKPANVMNVIAAEAGQTQSSMYTVPANALPTGYTFRITNWDNTCGKAGAANTGVRLELKIRLINCSFRSRRVSWATNGGPTNEALDIEVAAGADICVVAVETLVSNTSITASYDIISAVNDPHTTNLL